MADTPPPHPPGPPSVPPPPLYPPPARQMPHWQEPPREPTPLPEGFWPRVDHLMHNAGDIPELLRRDRDLWALGRTFLQIAVLAFVVYGAVMGGANFAMGSNLQAGAKAAFIVSSALKVPMLFLLTMLIILPPVYVSNAFVGAKLGFRQMVALMLASIAITGVILASMATVALFFSITSTNYDFIKLLHVAFFAYAGFVGILFLEKTTRKLIQSHRERITPTMLTLLWLCLYAFVGVQLAWVLRPFVGSPNEPYQLFRERGHGSFYESVFHSTASLLTDRDLTTEPEKPTSVAEAPQPLR